jgi:hypothetical protein
MSDEMYGHVASIGPRYRGAATTADAAAGATVLIVDDVADLAEEGGQLRIYPGDGTSMDVTYVSIDDDADTVTLSTGLAATVYADSILRVLDVNGVPVSVCEAELVDDNDGSVVTVDVAHALIPHLTDAVRAGTDESVVATRDSHGAWTITDVLGKSPILDAVFGYGVRVADMTITAGADAILAFDSFTGRGGILAASGVWTVPVGGRYIATANVKWEADVNGQRRVWFKVNGSDAGGDSRVNACSSGVTKQSVSQILDLAAGDEFSTYASCSTTAANLDVLAGTTVTLTSLD